MPLSILCLIQLLLLALPVKDHKGGLCMNAWILITADEIYVHRKCNFANQDKHQCHPSGCTEGCRVGGVTSETAVSFKTCWFVFSLVSDLLCMFLVQRFSTLKLFSAP